MNLYKKTEYMLYNYKDLIAKEMNLTLDIRDLKLNYEGIRAAQYKEHTGNTNKFNSNVENEIISKEKKIEYLESVKEHIQIKIKKIESAIAALEDRQKKIIELRYFNKLSWNKISELINLTEVSCRVIRNKSIKKLQLLLFNDKVT
ncbi:sigma factor-like helix-turn-helix DNA-binding protein [Clostridium oceanicum]|uniref:Sigma factor-like helix-turn-helix DNA-binding protein n=1 Tax=Clostridium oceanicum TaxID=1543 RepID=A0ABN1JBX1_9CLOT